MMVVGGVLIAAIGFILGCYVTDWIRDRELAEKEEQEHIERLTRTA